MAIDLSWDFKGGDMARLGQFDKAAAEYRSHLLSLCYATCLVVSAGNDDCGDVKTGEIGQGIPTTEY
jgi:hypothetical protein